MKDAVADFETNLTPLHWGHVSQAQWGGDGETIMQMSSLKSLKMPKLVFSSSPTRSAQSIRHVTSVSRFDKKAKWQVQVYKCAHKFLYIIFSELCRKQLGQVEHQAAFNFQGNQLNLIFRFSNSEMGVKEKICVVCEESFRTEDGQLKEHQVGISDQG